MKVSASFLKNLLDYASFQKMDIAGLKGIMINPRIDFSNSQEMIDAKEYVNVFENIIGTVKTSHCGLSIGEYLNLSSLGLVVEISLSTSSLRQGIYFLENFLKSKFPIVSFNTIEDLEGFTICFESPIENEKVKKELLDMVLYIVYRELKLMLPKKIVPKVRFPYYKKDDISLFFNEQVEYKSEHLVILPRNLDEFEINVNRIREIEILLPKFISMLNQEDNGSKEFSENVRAMALNMCNPEIPSLKQVQHQFAYSERTFQRKLTAEGTSFRNITNEIKKELSNYLMNEKHLKIKDIAYILGYSESSAYLHAIKGWNKKFK